MASRKRVDPTMKELRRLFMFNQQTEARHAFLRELGQLPPGVAPEVAERLFRVMFVDTFHDPTWAELITPEYARVAVKAYQHGGFGFFDDSANWILAAVDANADDATLARQLREAWVALKRLRTPPYAQTGEGIAATLGDPRWIEATQGAIAATKDNWNWSESMVGLLLADGSAGSIDVLIPMALQALEKKGTDLDKLKRLADRYGADTPEVAAFRARFKSEADDRAETSGANAFARAIGLTAKDDFQFKAEFSGVRKNGARIFELTMMVDAATAQWGWMHLLWIAGGRRRRMNEWSSQDERCFSKLYPMRKLERFPGWLADVAFARRCSFQLTTSSSNLEGDQAKRLNEWLQSATVPKKTGWATSPP